jgi:hypothetical protein
VSALEAYLIGGGALLLLVGLVMYLVAVWPVFPKSRR